jgi:hypothetical protein
MQHCMKCYTVHSRDTADRLIPHTEGWSATPVPDKDDAKALFCGRNREFRCRTLVATSIEGRPVACPLSSNKLSRQLAPLRSTLSMKCREPSSVLVFLRCWTRQPRHEGQSREDKVAL